MGRSSSRAGAGAASPLAGEFHPEESVWRVLPLEPPRLLRHCARCGRVRPFVSSEKFRLNAQQRHVDVWLVYRCSACDATWKREIFSRRAPHEIAADLYERLLRNDRETAWHYAFQTGDQAHENDGGRVRIERPPGAVTWPIRLAVPFPCFTRLERLLAAELAVSRGELRRWVEHDRLTVSPGGELALRRPPRDGTVLALRP